MLCPTISQRRTDQPALLLDDRPEVPEDVVQLVYPGFDIPDLCLPLGDQRLLELELLRRDPARQ